MGGNYRWKILSLVILLGLSVYALRPSFLYYSKSSEEIAAFSPQEAEKHEGYKDDALKLGLDLQGGMHLVLELDKTGLQESEVEPAMSRAMEILRNRIDRFGVSEPTVQPQGETRIVIELPGLLDKERAVNLIGQTARLEFKLLKQEAETRRIITRLDRAIAEQQFADDPDSESTRLLRPLLDRMDPELFMGGGLFPDYEVEEVMALLETVDVDSILPIDAAMHWGKQDEARQGTIGRVLYITESRSPMDGSAIASAMRQIGGDPARPNAASVSLTLNSQGARTFRRITSQNVHRQLAIVLDDRVASAPRITERIGGGQAQITGNFSDQEARDLAIVLQIGALPADINIIQEMTVGPSLGADSIRKGVRAATVGAGLIVVFLAIYYQGCGLIALLALLLNMIFLMAALAGMRGTLTLPGIAGLVLTIGMAVDANVLIFERIREEMRAGKKIQSAVQAGYSRAFRAILDANVTTLISSGVLWWIASGPIQGFATTLFIGILANLYTAVLVTRMILEVYTNRRGVEKLSI